MSKILITSVSAGAGHVRAAQAVEKYLTPDFEVSNIDVMHFSKTWFKTIYADKYLDIVNHYPKIWKILYNLSDKPSLKATFKTRRWIEYQSHKKFFEYVHHFQPEAIISTHFMPPEILIRLRNKLNLGFKIFVVITDFEVHYLWIHKEVDHYFVAGEQAKKTLIAQGIAENKITISGIPIQPQFFNSTFNISELKTKWNVIPNKKVITMMAGGEGIGALDQLVLNALEKHSDIQIFALAGKNKDLLHKLQNIQTKYSNLTALGFTQDVHELMSVSDLIVTKPGGLSTSECLSMKKPMLLINPIPGQEEHNVTYLEQLGVGKLAQTFDTDLNHMLNHLNLYQQKYLLLHRLDTEHILLNQIQNLLSS